MMAPNVGKCSAPNCTQEWHRLGEGKLFSFHVRGIQSRRHKVKYVWLCERCFESWQPTLCQDEIVMMPLIQRVG